MYLIEFDDVEVSFPLDNGGRKTVLAGLGLRIRPKEFLTVVGSSGCGKSTLLNMVFGKQRPTKGRVLLEGQPVGRIDRSRGMVFQNYSIFPHLTVEENVMEGILLERTSLAQCAAHTPGYYRVRREAREKAREILREVGLKPDDYGKFPHELSGGMRQRVAIAQSIIMQPKVLLMDEPYSGLDPRTRRGIQEVTLKVWQQYGMTVLFVTHNLEEALILGTRLVALAPCPAVQREGARIVVDTALPNTLQTGFSWRYGKEFNDLLAHLENDALNPESCLSLSQLRLDHPDAIRPANGKGGDAHGSHR